MFKIPDTYYQNNEDYITLPVIREFVDKYLDGKFRRDTTRKELLDGITTYAEQNEKHAEIVLSWIDDVLQEGIKDIYLQFMPLPKEMIEKRLAHLSSAPSQHICMNQYGKNYVLVSAAYSKDEYGRRITFTYCRKLYIHDKIKHRSKPIDYPVTADYFLDKDWLLVRAKPWSNLYQYEPDGFNLETATATTTEKEIR